jgi:hypothetical protein
MGKIILGDALEMMRAMPPQSVDLVFTSPPYENARTYSIGFGLKGQAWVDWMVPIVKESLIVCRGLVAFVVEGRTRHFSWSGTPVLLMADLIRAGVTLRKPPIYKRDGIPGSGGPDFWKNRYEFIICATNGGRLPWSDNVACGHPPKYGADGAMSHRLPSGYRKGDPVGGGVARGTNIDGTPGDNVPYIPPDKANPGNIIDCGAGGGGHLGSDLAHENEAPFPEALAEPFIRSFCPPGGTVLDCFGGSGTTAAVAEKHGRNWISIDSRSSQVDLMHRRLREVRGVPPMPVVK